MLYLTQSHLVSSLPPSLVPAAARTTTPVTIQGQYAVKRYDHNVAGAYVFWDLRCFQDRLE